MYKLIKRGMKEAKETWIEEQCKEIEDSLEENNSKRAYQVVKNLTTEKMAKVSTIQDKSGKSLMEEEQIIKRWTEYCSDLYNFKIRGDPKVLDVPWNGTKEDDRPILREEIQEAITALKKRKISLSGQHPRRTHPRGW